MVKKLCLVALLLLIEITTCRSADISNNGNSSFNNNNNNTIVSAEIRNKLPNLTHFGREHVSEKPIPNSVHLTNSSIKELSRNITANGNNANQSKLTVTKIQTENIKNNVSNANIVSGLLSSTKNIKTTTLKTSNPTPTVKLTVKKPLVTTHDDTADKANSLQSEKNVLPYNLMNIDPLLSEKKHKRSNYVVPIVAVILSVPLVAGLISIVYKRGKDWWLHRNYRRMDYLIEGLYNS